jgi:hypothetical protein
LRAVAFGTPISLKGKGEGSIEGRLKEVSSLNGFADHQAE